MRWVRLLGGTYFDEGRGAGNGTCGGGGQRPIQTPDSTAVVQPYTSDTHHSQNPGSHLRENERERERQV